MVATRIAAAALLQACWTAPPPSRPPEMAPPPQAPPPAPTIAPAEFRAMLDEEWKDRIDLAEGVVVLDGNRVDRLCPPNVTLMIRFEAINLAREIIAHELAANSPPSLTCRPLQRDVVECGAEGQGSHFRFAWRRDRFVLVGVAAYTGTPSRADADRYEDELHSGNRCPG